MVKKGTHAALSECPKYSRVSQAKDVNVHIEP
jgi:hypothetical protein